MNPPPPVPFYQPDDAASLATEDELRRLLSEWSGQGLSFDDGPSLAHRFQERAAATPSSIALSYDEVHLSYAALNARANQVAHFLRARGVGPETLVGLYLDRGIDLLVGLLGIIKSGGAYLPMDVAYPRDRLAFMTQDAASALVLSSESRAATFDGIGVQVIALDGPASPIGAYPTTNPPLVNTPEQLAYVIYTSGSTGRPKGCEVTHGNVIRLFAATVDTFRYSTDDVWTLFHSHAFDFSVWEMWGAWLHGGRVVVVSQAVSRSPEQFLDLLARERVTFLNQTPSAFKALAAAVASHPRPPVLSLRYVVFGGEVLEHESLRGWMAVYGDERPQLVNGYGITETTVFVSFHRVLAPELDLGANSSIGRPMADLAIYVLDEQQRVCAVGTPGELYIAGAGVTRGYLRRPELTAQRFVMWAPDASRPAQRCYRSGDLVEWLPSGELRFLGRIDKQVKIRGFRIEIGEIESVLGRHPDVASSAVVARHDRGREPRLVAYVVTKTGAASAAELRELMLRSLPSYMVPSAFVTVPSLPTTSNGKLDEAALPAPERARPEQRFAYAAPVGDVESACCEAFAEVLQYDRVGRLDNFFELGGDSLLAVLACERLAVLLDRSVAAAALFTDATPASLALSLSMQASDTPSAPLAPHATEESTGRHDDSEHPEPIAIVAMAARLPGADSTEEFWHNLLAERDGITAFTPDELDASVPPTLRNDAAYVAARGVLRRPEDFDPSFFGLTQRDGEIMDPQQRLLLELAWESLERAGYAPDRTVRDGQTVGVFAGTYSAEYIQRHVLAHPDIVEKVGAFGVMLATDKDYVATRIAHRLNLTGPAISIHTACSTALVAIVQAVDSLRAGRCNMALAGAASMTFPPRSGYLFQDGAMLSRDGVTRSFDAEATGTVFSDGGALVLLKRLSDAVADGDQIFAVIRGTAVNNDGGQKASFTAPSADGQAAVVAAAIRESGVAARSISYVEAHGTATPLGDPVEILGLTSAFRRGAAGTLERGFCRIGTAKSNVGHVVAAAGAVGVIKTALALSHETLPATLHFTSPNPQIDFAHSPFVVNHRRSAWPRTDTPRRAGVSAFGVGGTNAHVVLEEAPARAFILPSAGPQLLRVSARTPAALGRAVAALAEHLRTQPDLSLADTAFTLRRGRTEFSHRLCVVASDLPQAVDALLRPEHPRRAVGELPSRIPEAVFLFPGQGGQYAGMGGALYAAEPVFRDACDAVFAALDGVLPVDLRTCMFGDDEEQLTDTSATQPATFCLEYALASLWRSRSLEPVAMIGHSIGEFVAATIAGVMSVRDASRLVARRGQLMSALPRGAMLAVRLGADAMRVRVSHELLHELSVAAENSPHNSVVSGPVATIEALAAALESEGISCRRLRTSHAFHSAMMDPMLDAFLTDVQAISLSTPRLSIISTVTGQRLTDAEAVSPAYWARHVRDTVRFSQAVQTALRDDRRLFVEVGARSGLTTLVQQHDAPRSGTASLVCVPSLSDSSAAECEAVCLAAGRLWTVGINADAPITGTRRRVRLPTYPFERVRCWLDATPAESLPSVRGTESLAMLAAVSGSRAGSVPASVPIASIATLMTTFASPLADCIMDGLGNRTNGSASVGASEVADVGTRRRGLVTTLRSVIEDIAGMDLAEVDSSAAFLELGLDSLVLTQVALQVKRRFSVNLTFRQLMEQYGSLDALATFLDAALPADPAPIEARTPSAAAGAEGVMRVLTTVAPMGADEGSLTFAQQVVQQQLALMAQQLAILGAGPGAPPTVTPLAAAQGSTPASAPMASSAAPPTAVETDADLAHRTYDVKKAFGAIARIHTRASTELTKLQQQRLDAFLRRYAARTAASKAYTTAHRGHLADPRVVNGFRPQTKEICYQIVVNRSRGSRVWDLDGNEYVDVLNGFGMNLFGWQPAFVNEAVKRQLDEGHEIGPQHPLAGEVAALVCELTGSDRAALCNTGSEAVLGTIRVARTVTGRNLIVIFSGSYHGIFDEVLVRGTKSRRAVPAAPGILQSAAENVLVLDYGTPESLAIIRERADDLAAVVVEPVQSRRPDFQPREFLHELRSITEAQGTVLIFDEVITGFRTHLRGAQELFDVRADVAAYGKVIGGGYPIGVIAGKREFMDALDGGAWAFGDDSTPTVGVTYFAGTFVRHPLALAACHAVLLHLREQGPALQAALTARTTALVESMNQAARAVSAPVEVRQIASLWRIAFTEEHPLQDLLWAMMRDRGIHILDNFPCFLTTAHSDDDCAQVLRAFRDAIAEMQASEFFPPARVAPPEVVNADAPPAANARLGRDRDGSPAWFVPDPNVPGGYVKVAT